MSEGIITALISIAGTIIVACISYKANRAGAKEASESNAKLIAYRLEQLEKRVEEHNNVVLRVLKLEGRMQEAEHDIRDMKGAGK